MEQVCLCSNLLFVVVMLMVAWEQWRNFKYARVLFTLLWSYKSSVCLRPPCGLFRPLTGMDVSARGSLEVGETKSDHGAWFFSSSWEGNVG